MKIATLKRGFTLIELLIVIALLGALAVGLLAALDPFEQLKKGTDTGVRNTVSEIHGAVIRYYAIKNQMPWCDPTDTSGCTDLTTIEGGATVDADSVKDSMIQNIIDTGELKSNFNELAAQQLSQIFITGSNQNAEVKVCFQPKAKSFINDPNTKYDQDGTEITDGTCPGDPLACYWCVQ